VQFLVTKWLSTIAQPIVVGSISFASPTFARGGQSSEDPWNAGHINQLPVEIRNALARMCGSPQGAHYFATYFENSRVIKLHFEKFLCGGKEPFCTPAGCLHQTYVLTGSRYRLSRSYYAPGTD
jgi:hypothetical protein